MKLIVQPLSLLYNVCTNNILKTLKQKNLSSICDLESVGVEQHSTKCLLMKQKTNNPKITNYNYTTQCKDLFVTLPGCAEPPCVTSPSVTHSSPGHSIIHFQVNTLAPNFRWNLFINTRTWENPDLLPLYCK